MIEESQQRSAAVQKFWDAFKTCVEDNRVRPDRALFYVKWGQEDQLPHLTSLLWYTFTGGAL